MRQCFQSIYQPSVVQEYLGHEKSEILLQNTIHLLLYKAKKKPFFPCKLLGSTPQHTSLILLLKGYACVYHLDSFWIWKLHSLDIKVLDRKVIVGNRSSEKPGFFVVGSRGLKVETRFHCVALAILVLTVYTSWPRTQRSTTTQLPTWQLRPMSPVSLWSTANPVLIMIMSTNKALILQ